MTFFDLLKFKVEDVDKTKKNLYNFNWKFWDPIDKLNIEKAKENSAKVAGKYETIKNDPKIIKRHFRNAWIFAILFLPLALFVSFLFPEIIFSSNNDGIFFMYLLPFGPIVYVYAYYKRLAKDLLKIQIAQQKKWVYDPDKDLERWNNLKDAFPEIFNKGNNGQFVEDQFWAYHYKGEKLYYFYTGLFTYKIRRRSGKHSSNTTYNNHFFCIKLDKKLKSRFLLSQENIFTGFFGKKKEINVESIEFNETFSFSYNGSKGEKAMEIVKTLSPAVQEKLLEMNKRKNQITVLFTGECVIFLFKGFFYEKMYTNLKENVNLDERDEEFLTNELNDLIEISSGMTKYLD